MWQILLRRSTLLQNILVTYCILLILLLKNEYYSGNKKADVIEAFNYTSKYLDDLLNIVNINIFKLILS